MNPSNEKDHSDKNKRKLKPKYGEWFGRIYLAICTPEHVNALGPSVWLYLFLTIKADHQTMKVKTSYGQIKRTISKSQSTLEKWMANLEKHGYITKKSNGRGMIIKVEIDKIKIKKKSDTDIIDL